MLLVMTEQGIHVVALCQDVPAQPLNIASCKKCVQSSASHSIKGAPENLTDLGNLRTYATVRNRAASSRWKALGHPQNVGCPYVMECNSIAIGNKR